MPDLTPLAIPDDEWRSRWLQFNPRGRRLHRVAEIVWWDGEMIRGDGVAVCGQRGFMAMPGIFSRMDAQRCPRCCRALGIPNGYGAPANQPNEAWHNV